MSAEKFEQKIREKVEGAQMQPRPELWAAIEGQIAPKSSGRYLFWWWTLGVFVAGLAVAGIYIYMGIPQKTEQPSLTQYQALDQEIPSSISDTIRSEETRQTLGAYIPHATPTSSHHTSQMISGQPSQTMLPLAPSSLSSIRMAPISLAAPLDPALPPKLTFVHLEPMLFDGKKLPQAATLLDHEIASAPPVADPTHWRHTLATWSLYVQGGIGYGRKHFRDFTGAGAFTPSALSLSDIAYSDTYDFNLVPIPSENTDTIQVNRVAYPRYHQHAQIGIGRQYKRWGVRVGIGYRRSEWGRIETGFFPSNFVPIGEVDISELALNQQQTVTFRQVQLDLPVAVDYYLKRGASSLVLTAGWAGSYNLNRTKHVTFDVGPERTQDPLLTFNQWHSFVTGGIRYEHQLSPDLSLFLQPSFDHNLSAAYNNTSTAATEQNRMRINLDFGVKMRLW